MKTNKNFTSFHCKTCKTEIEASLDMIGTETECPACGAHLVVPVETDDADAAVIRHGADDDDLARTQLLKSRTIRIELGDL
jgi:DNA-directed RNA polymerase subunit RPC12/RpoP